MNLIEPKNTAGHKINNVWAFISVDEDGDEGLCACPINGVTMPMIASDEQRLKDLTPMAKTLAGMTGQTIKLIKLSAREDVRVINSD